MTVAGKVKNPHGTIGLVIDRPGVCATISILCISGISHSSLELAAHSGLKLNVVSAHGASDEVFWGRGAAMGSQNFTSGHEQCFPPS